jgi:wyosine [tRNA(Phe)-imidazoG37] synthetase (radical SAM superfamily)
MEKYVFGPVPSRRLGQSLGIDPVPLKTCNWNCVYCQLGRTRPFTTQRKTYINQEEILRQTKSALQNHSPGDIDWVTFIGSGETCLHSGLGAMIRAVKDMTDLPVAVITNGSLLSLPEVREELLHADAVLPTLDAGNTETFKAINRPDRSLSYRQHLEGLVAFRKVYKNKLWVEVMLVAGLNDQEAQLSEIAEALDKVQPDEIHILQPTRPPAETWVHPPDEGALNLAQAILGKTSKTILPAQGIFDLNNNEGDLVNAIVGIITRHPMKEAELVETLAQWSSADITKTLEILKQSGKAQVVLRYGTRFWSAVGTHFPKDLSDQ